MSDSALVKGNCRHCGAVIAFPGESAGELADCPSCGKAVMLTPRMESPPPVEQAEVMACPRCREPMSELDSVCVECGFRMPRRIPWVRLGAVGLIVLMGLYMWVRLEGMDPRVLNELRAVLGLSHKQFIATGISSGGQGSPQGGGGAAEKKDAEEPYIPGRLELVRVPAFELSDGQKYIVGSLKNTSNRDVFYEVTVKFRLSDAGGAALGMIQDYKDWVDPGETWDFRALVLDPDATKYEMVKPIGGER